MTISRIKPRKYRNCPTQGYDSKKEHKRAVDLKLLERVGQISDLKEQVKFHFHTLAYASGRKIFYVADFTYTEDHHYIVEDVKSPITANNPAYKIKKALMKYFHNIDIIET